MSKKTKSLGPANDAIPEDEMVLAKLLQTASAHGLVSCQGSFYQDKRGWAWWSMPTDGVTACCAMGASRMDPDRPVREGDFAVWGNDAQDDGSTDGLGLDDAELPGYTLGAAFEQALRPGS